jgi:cardiolipin synthase
LRVLKRLFGDRRESAGYCEVPDEFISGNRLALLRDGKEAYPAMLEAIARARRSVCLETYLLGSDRTGWRFARALAAKAREGVAVRVIYDSFGSLGIESGFVEFLEDAGVQMTEFRPVAPWRRRWGWGRRDHRKILTVDGTTGFTGGLNISDHYAHQAEGGKGWRDTHVRIEGPGAFELERLFRALWFKETGRWFSSAADLNFTPGACRLRVAANDEILHRHRIRRAYIHAINRARRTITIANAYFVPDRTIRHALYKAARRGVRVRILLPAVSDVPAVAYASRYLFDRHMRFGLSLFAWPGPVLHAKVAVVDGIWSALGSYNMDSRSLHHNLEVNVHVVDRAFSSELEEALLQDIRHSEPLRRDRWIFRPWSERVLERFLYLLRYWL